MENLLRQYNELLDHTAMILRFDDNLKICYVNEKFCEVYGYDAHEVYGQLLGFIDYEPLSPATHEEIVVARNSGKIRTWIIKNKKKNWDPIWTQTHISWLRNPDNVIVESIIVKYDVSHIYLLQEKLQELHDKKNAFIWLASHELRTPVTVIKGMASMLLEWDYWAIENPAIQNAIKDIYAETEKLGMIVQNLITITKLQTNSEIHKTHKDTTIWKYEIYNKYKWIAQEKKITFSVKVDSYQTNVEAPFEQLEIVLDSLYSNAVKFTPSGWIISIHVEFGLHNIRIEVVDSGVGLQQEKLYTLYESFHQWQDYTKRTTWGLGLWLSIVKSVIDRMGGDIHFDTELQKWTTVLISLKN